MAMKKWEHCSTDIRFNRGRVGYYHDSWYDINKKCLLEILNFYGSNGWELISISKTNYIFKRELDS